MEERATQAGDVQSEPNVFPVPYRPWFVAQSLKGRLFQLWMIAFFGLTYVVVSSDLVSQISVLGLPGNMGWIYLAELCTIAVLVVTYYAQWRKRAHRADRQVQKILEEETSAGPEGEPETSQRGASPTQ